MQEQPDHNHSNTSSDFPRATAAARTNRAHTTVSIVHRLWNNKHHPMVGQHAAPLHPPLMATLLIRLSDRPKGRLPGIDVLLVTVLAPPSVIWLLKLVKLVAGRTRLRSSAPAAESSACDTASDGGTAWQRRVGNGRGFGAHGSQATPYNKKYCLRVYCTYCFHLMQAYPGILNTFQESRRRC
jgi:hypothetical protein